MTFTPYLVLCAVHLLLLETGPDWSVTATKALLMPLLALGVVLAARRSALRVPWLLLLAIGLSWAGDVALSFPGMFVVGLGAFLLAHVAYITVFLRMPGRRSPGGRRRPPLWTLVYAAWFVGFVALLGPHTGGLLVPVALYGLVLGLMATFAASHGRIMAVGGALFVASDSVLGLGRFLPGYEFALHDVTVMATYLAAQLLISIGVLAALRASAPSSREPGRPVGATAP
ncbi:lysoplasmalogenase [Agromyces sp. Leaf222]|uniref:lysoplasmalogenase n=1 Tax=Agromyces sp. Leaf222 TaxID=1735688 RepID=UPI0012F77CAB|nr:lysoplasmalogenase [Agromyces sp. Leaf222]